MNDLQTALQRLSHPLSCTNIPISRVHPLRSAVHPKAASDGALPDAVLAMQKPKHSICFCWAASQNRGREPEGIGSLPPTACLTLVTRDCLPSGTKPAFPAMLSFIRGGLMEMCVCSDWKSCWQRKLRVFVRDRGHNATLNTAKLHGARLLSTRLSLGSLGNGQETVKNTVAEAVLENGIAYRQARHSCAC